VAQAIWHNKSQIKIIDFFVTAKKVIRVIWETEHDRNWNTVTLFIFKIAGIVNKNNKYVFSKLLVDHFRSYRAIQKNSKVNKWPR
jgi:hypothetical protein